MKGENFKPLQITSSPKLPSQKKVIEPPSSSSEGSKNDSEYDKSENSYETISQATVKSA